MTSKKEAAVRRIKALRKFTEENGASEHEALTALSKMNNMLTQYNLSMTDIELDESECDEREFNTELKKEHSSVHCLGAIMQLTNTRATVSKYKMSGKITYNFFGLPHDTEIAVYMIETIFNAMEYEYKQFFKQYRKTYEYKNRKQFHINAIKSSFLTGMAYRIIERCAELYKEQQQKYQEEYEATGRDLVVVKNQIVEEEFAKRYNEPLNTYKSNATINNNPTVLRAGYVAGDNVQLNKGINS